MPGHLPVTVMCVELRYWGMKVIQNMVPLKKTPLQKKKTPLKKKQTSKTIVGNFL